MDERSERTQIELSIKAEDREAFYALVETLIGEGFRRIGAYREARDRILAGNHQTPPEPLPSPALSRPMEEAPAPPPTKPVALRLADVPNEVGYDPKDPWAKHRAAARGKRASKEAVQEWVANHMADGPDKIPLDQVPTTGAVAFLIWAQANQELFYKEFLKVGAGKKQAQADGRLTDDGRSITDILTQFERSRSEVSVLPAGSERPG